MFAVIRTGGKQYRVTENARIEVERLPGDPGETIALGDVLMIGGDEDAPLVGAPLVDNAAVFAEVVEQKRGPKILVFKKKRRKHYRRTRGHRQELTVLRVTGISPTGEAPLRKSAVEADSGVAAEAASIAPEYVAPDATSAGDTKEV
ncbi:MAG: 50S ribosomal protein L21 [Rhodospirillales bacterium]|nr:50S ribosomal protein L21 [Rhodospirillales bacterium]